MLDIYWVSFNNFKKLSLWVYWWGYWARNNKINFKRRVNRSILFGPFL